MVSSIPPLNKLHKSFFEKAYLATVLFLLSRTHSIRHPQALYPVPFLRRPPGHLSAVALYQAYAMRVSSFPRVFFWGFRLLLVFSLYRRFLFFFLMGCGFFSWGVRRSIWSACCFLVQPPPTVLSSAFPAMYAVFVAIFLPLWAGFTHFP